MAPKTRTQVKKGSEASQSNELHNTALARPRPGGVPSKKDKKSKTSRPPPPPPLPTTTYSYAQGPQPLENPYSHYGQNHQPYNAPYAPSPYQQPSSTYHYQGGYPTPYPYQTSPAPSQQTPQQWPNPPASNQQPSYYPQPQPVYQSQPMYSGASGYSQYHQPAQGYSQTPPQSTQRSLDLTPPDEAGPNYETSSPFSRSGEKQYQESAQAYLTPSPNLGQKALDGFPVDQGYQSDESYASAVRPGPWPGHHQQPNGILTPPADVHYHEQCNYQRGTLILVDHTCICQGWPIR